MTMTDGKSQIANERSELLPHSIILWEHIGLIGPFGHMGRIGHIGRIGLRVV